jgi:hypothetical protein
MGECAFASSRSFRARDQARSARTVVRFNRCNVVMIPQIDQQASWVGCVGQVGRADSWVGFGRGKPRPYRATTAVLGPCPSVSTFAAWPGWPWHGPAPVRRSSTAVRGAVAPCCEVLSRRCFISAQDGLGPLLGRKEQGHSAWNGPGFQQPSQRERGLSFPNGQPSRSEIQTPSSQTETQGQHQHPNQPDRR